MPNERLSMRRIKEVLRLHSLGLNPREIGQSCGISRTAVRNYLLRAKEAGLSWPIPENMDELDLENHLFRSTKKHKSDFSPLPDWSKIHSELRKKGVTLLLIWEEFKDLYPEGLQYSQFCNLYRHWRKRLDLVMRQDHKAGEKLFVDYCGQTIPILDQKTGKPHQAQIFVAVLGASNYTYAEASRSQSLDNWIGAHERTFHFFGGVQELVIPDNLKSGVSKACRYDPDINPTYHDFSVHYNTTIMPARVRKPRDKAKAEAGVLLVERWILARLRHYTFFNLEELKQKIGQLLQDLNSRKFKKMSSESRQSLFEKIDKPALKKLPDHLFPNAQWKSVTLGKDYHIEVEGHYYSVPYQLVSSQVDIRFTNRTVECFFKGNRVASHSRSNVIGGKTTLREHMPESHQIYLDCQSPDTILEWAEHLGENVLILTKHIIKIHHPQKGVRVSLGILRLGRQFGNHRLDAACARALAIGSSTYKSIKSILKNGLDKTPLPGQEQITQPIDHENIRGSDYYH